MGVTQVQSSASIQTIYTPAAPTLTVGPVIAASTAGLHQSTDPLEGENVLVRSGWEWTPPYSATPSTSNPTPPPTNFVGKTTTEVTAGTVTIEHVPIINIDEASIVTVNPDGKTTVDENNATTTAADLSKYTKGFLSGKTVNANGTITAFSSATASSQSTKNALDVTA